MTIRALNVQSAVVRDPGALPYNPFPSRTRLEREYLIPDT